ncbi:hypothetical protein HWV62_32150 [Athelia sp. TMB]|nr:hypothetical protein HWV62_32150 [Athelia sp. TMB]
MSTTTQILFNSPALSSLKRDQLVKLCKIHSIKANGKNVDLVDKLKEHAKTLGKDDPLSIAAGYDSAAEDLLEERVEEEGDTVQQTQHQLSRPSEQWEIVMDTIEEREEGSGSRSSTLRSVQSRHGQGVSEFGTGGIKASSVSSSIKALANSLGLKRGALPKPDSSVGSHPAFVGKPHTKQSLHDDQYFAGNSIPYALLAAPETLPHTDTFTSALPDTRDSSLDQPVPGHPSYPGLPAPANARLSMGLSAPTPSKQGPSTTIRLVGGGMSQREEPATPQLRPFETAFDLVAGTPFGKLSAWPASPTTERTGKIYPSLAQLALDLEPDAPSEDEAENGDMSSALAAPNFTPAKPTSPAPFVFGSPLPQNTLTNTGFSSAAASVLDEMNARLASAGVQGLSADILERKRVSDAGLAQAAASAKPTGSGIKNKFDKMHDSVFEKMQGIDTHYAARRPVPIAGNKRKSDALGPVGGIAGKKTKVPGAFGDDDENDEEEQGRRTSKRPKFEKGRRISIAPPPGEGEGGERSQKERDEEAARLAKEREAIKRKLELNKQRRRSSMGRPSLGRGPVAAPKAKPASRFGFLSSAKSLVASVWGRGSTKTPAAPPLAKAPAVAKKPAVPFARPSIATPSAKARVASDGSVASTSSRVKHVASRAPIPSFGAPVAHVKSPPTTSARASGSLGGSRSSFNVKSSGSRVSSLGARGSAMGGAIAAGSMGVKRPSENGGGSTARKSTSSRLLAPTASSLAKRQPAGIRASLLHDRVSEDAAPPTPKPTLAQITNDSRIPTPRVSKIFSQPLSSSPTKPSLSLGESGAVLGPGGKPPIPPKPKVLPGRRPRVSRSKVIAKLAVQRAASSSGAPAITPGVGKTRSSIGAQRKSYGGAKMGRSVAGDGVMMSAKKRARQDEFARRRSRAIGEPAGSGSGSHAMEVDA